MHASNPMHALSQSSALGHSRAPRQMHVPKRKSRRAALAAVAALVAAPALVACSGAPVEPEVGLCFSTGGSRALDGGVDAVPCNEPHECEIVGVHEAVGGPYPGQDTLTREAHETCVEQFEEYTGSTALESVYDLYPMVPTEKAWEAGDTSVLCVARLPGTELLSRTVKDTGR